MYRTTLTLLAAALALAACADHPASAPADPSRELVITQGIAAPPARLAAPAGPRRSDLAAAATVNGSSTTPVSLNGQNCTTFPAQTVVVTYTVSGRQDHAASFQVNTKWVYDGTSFVGSVPTTVNVPARAASAAATIIPVSVSVENGTTGGSGSTSFTIDPINVVTSSPAALTVANGDVEVQVEFSTCAASNTAPALVVPSDLTVEATSSSGAAVSFAASVTASDAEDGNLTASVICTPASGGTFALGQTTVNCSVTDSGGMSAAASFKINVVDTTAPVFSGVPAAQVSLIAANISGAQLDIAGLGITAADVGGVSPPVSISCTPGNGSVIPIGQLTTVSCTATDNSSHPSPNTSAAVQFNVFVTLNVSPLQFLSPLRMTGPFSAHKLGSTVPHKFPAPTYADGTPATDLASGLRLALVKGIGSESYEQTTSADFATGSTAWRYDALTGTYVFNLQTQKTWGEGQWETTVSYAGIELASTYLSFRK